MTTGRASGEGHPAGAPHELPLLVARSQSIGADHDLVVHGGGNTSAKGSLRDHLGRVRDVLWVKGSGADLETAAAADYPGLWLEDLLALHHLDELSDERMTDLLRAALVDPSSRRPSIETLLHAFVPYRHVDHVHADSIVALTKAPDAEDVVRRALGDRVGFVPWIRPGFTLGKLVADLASLDGVVLAHHGLVTWADDSEECLARTRDLVAIADAYLADASAAPGTAGVETAGVETAGVETAGVETVGVETVEPGPADGLAGTELEELLLALRGALSRRGHKVLRVDRRLRSVADRPDLPAVVAAGVATADHMLRMRPWAAAVAHDASEHPAAAAGAIDAYEADYRNYFGRNTAALPQGFSMHDPAPAAVLVPGLGAVTAGADERSCQVVADILEDTAAVATRALDAFGTVRALPEDAVFDVDYWPLELYKLSLAPSPPPLAGQVVCVTGAASGIGRAVATHLAGQGASLVLGDLDGDRLHQLADQIETPGGGRPECTVGDVSDEEVVRALVSGGVRRFGGFDGFVANAGVASMAPLARLDVAEWRRLLETNLTSAMLLTKAALGVLRRQGLGGSIVYVASKNAFGPGKEFGAYSVSKAGMVQLMRIAAIEGGPDGIRANAVNPDAVFEGSNLWSSEMRRQRAAAHGVAPEEIEAFYARRNLLGAPVSAGDVAEAVAFLVSAKSARTTGAVIPVDGGLVDAFPR